MLDGRFGIFGYVIVYQERAGRESLRKKTGKKRGLLKITYGGQSRAWLEGRKKPNPNPNY